MRAAALFTAFLLCLPMAAFSKMKAVQVLYPSHWRLVDLNSWSGRPRNSVQLTLPPHTVKLVYTLSSVSEQEVEFVRASGRYMYQFKHYRSRKPLAAYLEDLYSGKAEDSLKSLPFINPIDTLSTFGAFLFTDSLNTLAFDKGQPTECVNVYSFPKFRGGTVNMDIIDDPEPNHLWVGFANSSTSQPVYVMVEAAAMVDAPEDTLQQELMPDSDSLAASEDYKEAIFPGPTDVPHYIYDNMSNMAHRTNICTTVRMTISERGLLHDVRILQGGDYELDTEILRVLSEMPLWKPALKAGKPVKSYQIRTFCY